VYMNYPKTLREKLGDCVCAASMRFRLDVQIPKFGRGVALPRAEINF